VSSVLRPLQHSIGYIGDGFYRSKDPTNSIKVLTIMAVMSLHQNYLLSMLITLTNALTHSSQGLNNSVNTSTSTHCSFGVSCL